MTHLFVLQKEDNKGFMAAQSIFFSNLIQAFYSRLFEKCVEQTPMFNKVFYLKVDICEESKLKKASFRHRAFEPDLIDQVCLVHILGYCPIVIFFVYMRTSTLTAMGRPGM